MLAAQGSYAGITLYETLSFPLACVTYRLMLIKPQECTYRYSYQRQYV